jgi:hypothetical protein
VEAEKVSIESKVKPQTARPANTHPSRTWLLAGRHDEI